MNTRLYKNWWVHNMFAHPTMQVLNSLGFHTLAAHVHDSTLPDRPVATKLTDGAEGVTHREQ